MNNLACENATALPGEKERYRIAQIRALSDALRQCGRGGAVCVTSGVTSLEMVTLALVIEAVTGFEAFTPDNDPYGEHDCAVLTVAGVGIISKIDYYDRAYTGLSPNPADPGVTSRVLTIMLSSEY